MSEHHLPQPTTSATASSPDYQKTLLVDAGPDALFDALTTAVGLTGWWTRAAGSGQTGGELSLFMNDPQPLRIRVDQSTRPSRVDWTVTDCPFLTEWEGTQPTFTITARAEGAELHFRHRGLNADLDCLEMCSHGWDHFLASLASYVDSGRGSPLGSEDEQASRARRLVAARPERTTTGENDR